MKYNSAQENISPAVMQPTIQMLKPSPSCLRQPTGVGMYGSRKWLIITARRSGPVYFERGSPKTAPGGGDLLALATVFFTL